MKVRWKKSKMTKKLNIGLVGASTKSGHAFLADFLDSEHNVYGYARESEHGKDFVSTINDQGGIFLQRPEAFEEQSRFIPLNTDSIVGHNLEQLVQNSDVIILAHPAIYQVESAEKLRGAGILNHKSPIVLAPSRSFATPYLWEVLGHNYPVVAFSTCPYSCKTPETGTSFIKRRKRNWVGSWEGDFKDSTKEELAEIWPQVLWTDIPGATTLNNIGAIFHPAPYILAWDEIQEANRHNQTISYYMELIADRTEVGEVLEDIDQMRLGIAESVGIPTFGYKQNPREDEWRDLMAHLRSSEEHYQYGIEGLRSMRAHQLKKIGQAVVGFPHWLDYTYGVERVPNEHPSQTIGRTPTYQNRSVPQSRYVEEDVPASLLPLESIAKKFGVDCETATMIIDQYSQKAGFNVRHSQNARNLQGFDKEFLTSYLTGNIFHKMGRS
ncbi:MAG: hypothetical protein MAG795_00447 [Candidatus Woesearchaeota archaeon]|nr:hypothetical protein [Candidatus Woesearchaeota archaeon]